MRLKLVNIARHGSTAYIVLALGVVLSAVVANLVATQVERAGRVHFDSAVSNAHNAIEARIRAYSEVLVGVRGLMMHADSPTRAEFNAYVDSLELARRYPGIQVIHFAQRVSGAEKAAFEAAARKDTSVHPRGYPDFKVKPAGERSEYAVVTYVEPMAGNQAALGLDLAGDAVRLAALSRTRDSGRLTASGAIALALEPHKYPGFAMRLPVYRKGMPLESVAERREAFIGVVSASFVVIDLMKGVLSDAFLQKIHVGIQDSGFTGDAPGSPSPAADKQMFDSDRLLAAASARQASADIKAAELTGVTSLEVGGRRWELRFSARQDFFDAAGRWLPWLALLGGITITLLLFGLTRLLATSGDRALKLADRITEHLRKSEASLAEAQRMTQQLIEALPNPIFFKDTGGHYLGVNKAWEKYFGVSRQAFIGKSVHDLYPDNPEVADLLHAKDQILWDSPGSQEYETSIAAAGGQRREAIYYKATFTHADGAVAGLIGTIIDITERKRAEAAAREGEERYRTLIEWSPEPLYVHREGKIIFVNAAAIRMFGASSAGELLGKPVLDTIHPDFRQVVLARLEQIKDQGLNVPLIELKQLKVDGTVIEVEAQATTIVFDGAPAIHVAARDITQRKQAEAARASLEAQLRESQKMQAIGTLAGGIAHDFNNALATILGNVELARQDVSANPLALESLEEIRKAGARTRDLVQQILSFSRRQPTELKAIALSMVVDESARLLRATLPGRVAIEVNSDADVPLVLGDATQLEQILINIATNAMQAMRDQPGRIVIRLDTVVLDAALARTHPELAEMHARRPGRTARLAVSDNGPGMGAAMIGRIFEPFFTTKPVGEGTGLGLSVVHGIVQSHEGAIVVDSTPGKGTTFTIYLSVDRRFESGAPPPEPDRRAAVAVTAATAQAQGGLRILYVDDDDSLVLLVRRLLERRGFRVSGYTDQREALDALRADPGAFDLVVSDYNMPGMSGLEVICEAQEIRADLPVAIASGFIDETMRAEAAALGVRELIFKADAAEDLCDAFARLANSVGKTSRVS